MTQRMLLGAIFALAVVSTTAVAQSVPNGVVNADAFSNIPAYNDGQSDSGLLPPGTSRSAVFDINDNVDIHGDGVVMWNTGPGYGGNPMVTMGSASLLNPSVSEQPLGFMNTHFNAEFFGLPMTVTGAPLQTVSITMQVDITGASTMPQAFSGSGGWDVEIVAFDLSGNLGLPANYGCALSGAFTSCSGSPNLDQTGFTFQESVVGGERSGSWGGFVRTNIDVTLDDAGWKHINANQFLNAGFGGPSIGPNETVDIGAGFVVATTFFSSTPGASVQFTVVPVPATLPMLACCLGLIARARVRGGKRSRGKRDAL